MPTSATFLAADLGADSGRVLLGHFDGERVSLEEVHRFLNRPVRLIDGLHWDVLSVFQQLLEGLSNAAARSDTHLDSMGVDSWAVDFGLLDRDGHLLSNPYHYRDSRTEGMVQRALERMPGADIYRTTGIQVMPINTLYQLLAMRGEASLEAADTLLMIPDLLAYWLTGEKSTEWTNASTTQLCDARSRDWARGLIERMELPGRIFPGIVQPGTRLGDLLPAVVEDVGLGASIPVMAVASHDTASAVVGVPAMAPNFAYISSGTWSLVGVETRRPILTPESMEANFTNEGGFGGTVRYLKNVMGLWLLQECRRTWAREGQTYSYDELVEAAEAEAPFGPLVDPDGDEFLPPGDMPGLIRSYCGRTGQAPPESPGQVVRCILESLALKYRWVLERVEELSGRSIEVVHVVGGGVRNTLLCSLTADATRRPVLAGPAEATAIGNLLVQAFAGGYLASLEEMRAVVHRSTEIRTYPPGGDAGRWDEAYERFGRIMAAAPVAARTTGGG